MNRKSSTFLGEDLHSPCSISLLMLTCRKLNNSYKSNDIKQVKFVSQEARRIQTFFLGHFTKRCLDFSVYDVRGNPVRGLLMNYNNYFDTSNAASESNVEAKSKFRLCQSQILQTSHMILSYQISACLIDRISE